ncbi:MAG: rRNA maturation RNase YbeY [Elusimicrobia bacterium]|nr:rRNA maturation RNase YbeY [Elusimicrobiota bacterium]
MKIRAHFKCPVPRAIGLKKHLLVKTAAAALKRFKTPGLEVNLILVNEREIRKINRFFLNRTYAADVIAFNYHPGKDPGSVNPVRDTGRFARKDGCIRPPSETSDSHPRQGSGAFSNGVKGPKPFGDIYICAPRAKEQAAEMGHSLLTELLILSAHGALHLAGLEDDTPKKRKLMNARTAQLLKKLL